MATHSRTELFTHFRNSYHAHHGHHQNKRLSMTGDEDDLLTMTIRPEHHVVQIESSGWRMWLDKERKIRKELHDIDICIDRLVESTGRVRYQTVFSAQNTSVGESSLSDEIVGRLLNVRQMINNLVIGEYESDTTMGHKIKVNCQLALFHKLSAVAQRFQSAQRTILQRMRSDTTNIHDTRQDTPQSDLTWSPRQSATTSSMFMLEEDFAAIHSQEYDNIVNGMRSIAALCKQMHLMVVEQGSLLDRIDYNLEHAQAQTRAAVHNITKRGNGHDLDKRKLVVLFLVIMIIVLTTAVILKPKPVK